MIKTSWQIPSFVDINDPKAVQQFLMDMKMVVEEIIEKAQQTQMEVRSNSPDVNSIEEGEAVPSVESGTYKLYRKISGSVKSVTYT